MKVRVSILAMACLAIILTACNKYSSGIKPITASIVGKWYQNKEEISQINGGVAFVFDTVFAKAAFDSLDFFQFNNDGTASVSSSGDFEVYGKTTVTDGNGNPIAGKNTYTYSVSGSILTLTSTFIHPTPCCAATTPVTDSILTLNENTLVLYSTTGPQSAPEISRKLYYTRGN